jgi:DNA repair exonuclease SbcCD nuclease subunit
MKTFKEFVEEKPLEVFRLIGDVHGKHEQLIKIASKAKYSLALGDIGFDYTLLSNLDSDKHKMIGGNHDNYTKDENNNYHLQSKHFLGDFGQFDVPRFGEIFYIRGGNSVDKQFRTAGKNWWEDEQLSTRKLYECVEEYSQKKPWFVVSHECPSDVVPFFITNSDKIFHSKTAQALQSMFDIHQPKYWFFGHHHKTDVLNHKNTTFHCLGELDFYDFPLS